MERTILDKLVSEVRHFHNRDFLKAAMAVCALAAVADDEVKLSEHYRINAILAKEPALLALDSKKAIDTLYVYVNALQTDWSSAAEVLYKKVRRMELFLHAFSRPFEIEIVHKVQPFNLLQQPPVKRFVVERAKH